MSAVKTADRQENFLMWRHIADEVRRSGADGLVFISESWLLRGEAAMRGMRPTDARDREEAVDVFAATSTGEKRSLITPFTHGFLGRIKLGETHELLEGAFNSFAPVGAVWARADGVEETRPPTVRVPSAAGIPRPRY